MKTFRRVQIIRLKLSAQLKSSKPFPVRKTEEKIFFAISRSAQPDMIWSASFFPDSPERMERVKASLRDSRSARTYIFRRSRVTCSS